MVVIKVAGKEVECAMRMGALRMFSAEFGKEFEAIRTLTDICEFMYCCARCAARIEQTKFDMSVDEFADGVSLHELSAAFTTLVNESGASSTGSTEAKKK